VGGEDQIDDNSSCAISLGYSGFTSTKNVDVGTCSLLKSFNFDGFNRRGESVLQKEDERGVQQHIDEIVQLDVE
jgi:hypothetical protein